MSSSPPKQSHQQQQQQQFATAVPSTRHVDIVVTSTMPPSTTSTATETQKATVTSNGNDDDSTPTAVNLEQKLLGRIYLPPDEVDPLALKQVIAMCSHPACTHVRAMPDCCKGNGCTVGFTCSLTQCISPQLIGGDIACGITAIPISKKVVERRNGLERILNVIHDCVPMGGGAGGVQQSPAIRIEQYLPFLEEASQHWRDFNAAYLEKFGVNLDQYATQKYASFIPPPHEAENINALGNCMTSSSSSSSSFINTPPSSSGANFTANATTTNNSNNTNNSNGKHIAKFQYTLAWLQKRVQEWGITMEQMKCSMLSLGQGNHFLELNQLTFSLDDHSSAMATPPSSSTSEGKSNNNAKNSSSQKNNTSKDSKTKNDKKGGGKSNTKNKNKNNNDDSDDSDEDEDDDEQQKNDDQEADELPEYMLSCHTGSRAVGQAVYRFWTKKCAQYQQARVQLQLLQQHQLASGGKLTAEQLQQLAQATATLATTIITPTPVKNDTASVTSSAKAKTQRKSEEPVESKSSAKVAKKKEKAVSSNKKASGGDGNAKKTKKQDADDDDDEIKIGQIEDNNNRKDEDDDEEDKDEASNIPESFPLPKNDDDESIAFNSGFLLTSPEDLACYYMDVIYAQAFASMNRRAILSTVFYHLGEKAGKFSDKKIIETVHNYIDFKDFVIRKGAVRAHEGEKILIGLNMKEGIWLCRGKGNPEWNYSSAHGCGRIKSRSSAAATQSKNSGKGSNKSQRDDGSGGSKAMKKEDPRIKEFKKEMGEVVSKSVNAETFDERPSVYRNSNLVRSLLDPSVEIICRYKTILNCKGGN